MTAQGKLDVKKATANGQTLVLPSVSITIFPMTPAPTR